MNSATAAVLHEVPGRLELETIRVADPGPGEVLVRTRAVGLCHSDINVMSGKHARPMPAVVGHEVSGEVAAVGSGVRSVHTGARVVVSLAGSCGSCSPCARGEFSLCTRTALQRGPEEDPRLTLRSTPLHAAFGVGGLSELLLVSEDQVAEVSELVPFAQAALLGCAVITGVGAVLNTARVRPGQSVAVVGCGGIGVNAIQGARLVGASVIIAVDTDPQKLTAAVAMGATHTVDASSVDVSEAVREIVPAGIDASFEAAGLPATARLAFDLLREGGTATVIGMLSEQSVVEIPGWQLLRGRRIQGSVMGSTSLHRDVATYADLYARGLLDLDSQLGRTLTLEQSQAGYDALAAGGLGRQVVVFE